MATWRTWIRDFRDLLSPRYCAVCGGHLNSTEDKLCSACLMALPYVGRMNFYDNPMARMFWGKVPVERAYSYLYYSHDSPSHLLLLRLKYGHRPDLGTALGRMIARDLKEDGFFEGVDAIVPVPLHWRRQWHRGYNQSMQLARGLAEVLVEIPILQGCVKRVRNNETQTSKTYYERMDNVRDLFKAKGGIPFRHLLLVDDVLTTSATLSACAQAILRENPAVSFSILTLAKA